MLLSGWLSRFYRKPRPMRRRLELERLEDRTLPSTVTWANTGSGNWDVPANWSSGKVPGSADVVVINTAAAASITVKSGDSISIAGLSTASDDTLSITGGSLTVTGGTNSLAGPLAMTGGALTASGAGTSLTASGTTAISAANLFAKSGALLSLPNLASYVSNGNTFQADGASSVLDVSALTGVTQQSNWNIDATNGGEVKLTGMTSLTSTHGISIIDTTSSTLLDGSVTTLNGVNVSTDGTDLHVADAWTSLQNGSLTVTGGSLSLASLTNVNGSNLTAKNGGQLALPNLASYVSNGNTFQADGASSVLDVPALTGVTQQSNWNIDATNGGEVRLTGLTSLTSTHGISVTDINNSTLLDGSLTTLSGVNVTTDGSDAHFADTWTSFQNGILTLNGGSYTLTALTNIDGSSVSVNNGGQLALPNVTSYASNGNTFLATATNTATNTPSLLDLPALASVTQQGSWNIDATKGAKLELTALTSLSLPDGGTITDTGGSTLLVTNLTNLNGANVNLDGSDAQVVNSWTSLTNGTLKISGGDLTLSNLTSLAGSNLQLGSGITASFPVLTKGAITLANGQAITIQGTNVGVPADGSSGVSLNVPASAGLSITFKNSGTFTGTTVNVGQGSTATFFGGTYLGGVTFNVASAGSVNLVVPGSGPGSAGAAELFGGTLTGSGGGTVILDGSDFYGGGIGADTGGMTLDFPANMFQWQAGWMFGRFGNVTNTGTMNLTGADNMILAEDGTLFNYGTIIQTGTNTLNLDEEDKRFPTELVNESGASYLIQSDTGIVSTGGGPVEVQNAGSIVATAGSGTATLSASDTLTNTGTIAVNSGTLALAANSFAQISGTTLTGGTWSATGGATLQFPSGTNLTTSQANLTIDGSGAAIQGIANLASSSGTFSLTNGASFTTTGDFTNSGSLTVGAGSTLNVTGNFTQISGGTLTIQIGGTAGSGQFGRVAVSNAATLAGSFSLTLVNAYVPSDGQPYDVVSFASATGNFSSVTGLSPYFTEALAASDLMVNLRWGGIVNLVTSNVTAATTASAGQQITVDWQVSDKGPQTAPGNWQDSVYLSPTDAITSTSVLLGAVPHAGGLAVNASYNSSWTGAVPALAPGYYYVLVQADSLYQTQDNPLEAIAAASTGLLQVTVPALTVGTPLNDSFSAADQDHYYQVTVTGSGSLQITLASTASAGAVNLYVSKGSLPTPYSYQDAANVTGLPNQTVNIAVLGAGTYYILAHSVAGAAATAGYTVTANLTNGLSVSAISSYQGGDWRTTTIEIDGANFSPNTTATLTLGATTIEDTSIYFASASQIFATFPLGGAALGSYTVQVQDGPQSATAPALFQVALATHTTPPPVPAAAGDAVPADIGVVGGQPLPLQVSLSVPQYVRSGRTGTIIITYTNRIISTWSPRC